MAAVREANSILNSEKLSGVRGQDMNPRNLLGIDPNTLGLDQLLNPTDLASFACTSKRTAAYVHKLHQNSLNNLLISDDVPEYLKKTMRLYQGKLAPINCIYLAWNKLVERRRTFIQRLGADLLHQPANNYLHTLLIDKLRDSSGRYTVRKFIELSKTIKVANSILFLNKFDSDYVSSQVLETDEYDADAWGSLLRDYLNRLKNGSIHVNPERNLTKLDTLVMDRKSGIHLPEELGSLSNITRIFWLCTQSSLENSTLPPLLESLDLRGIAVNSLNGIDLPGSLKILDLSRTNITRLSGTTLPAGIQVRRTFDPYEITTWKGFTDLLDRILLRWLPSPPIISTWKWFTDAYVCVHSKATTLTKIKKVALYIIKQSGICFLASYACSLSIPMYIKYFVFVGLSQTQVFHYILYSLIKISMVASVLNLLLLVLTNDPRTTLVEKIKRSLTFGCILVGSFSFPLICGGMIYSEVLRLNIDSFIGMSVLINDLVRTEKNLPPNEIPRLTAD